MKLLIFDFHSDFEFLKGMDTIKLLNAQIDLKNNLLTTTHSQHTIHYTQKQKTIRVNNINTTMTNTKHADDQKNPLANKLVPQKPSRTILNITETLPSDFSQSR